MLLPAPPDWPLSSAMRLRFTHGVRKALGFKAFDEKTRILMPVHAQFIV